MMSKKRCRKKDKYVGQIEKGGGGRSRLGRASGRGMEPKEQVLDPGGFCTPYPPGTGPEGGGSNGLRQCRRPPYLRN